jgi:hypothetical protein
MNEQEQYDEKLTPFSLSHETPLGHQFCNITGQDDVPEVGHAKNWVVKMRVLDAHRYSN